MAGYRSDQIRHGEIYGWHVYVITEPEQKFCKIGSTGNVPYRIATLQTGNPRRLHVFKSWHLDSREQARNVERKSLEALLQYRLPLSEWLSMSADESVSAVERVISQIGGVLRTDTKPQWSRV